MKFLKPFWRKLRTLALYCSFAIWVFFSGQIKGFSIVGRFLLLEVSPCEKRVGLRDLRDSRRGNGGADRHRKVFRESIQGIKPVTARFSRSARRRRSESRDIEEGTPHYIPSLR
ncbi:hypothetical protein RchiOBHm_Chr6g0277791 [Rosa chinensis]|uniref:Uncharacterized protein n=1 Tax=Rosa chinensis TaxID=74649 RepID=A0A2P6PSM5_ROSCH|nr:hypothetical protein RchiOBHm_Chr6g0277791 [Rosa chinensis]